MNVVIGVLGESYDVENDRARISFLQSRAAICAEYSSRIIKTARPIGMYRVIARALHAAEHSTLLCCLRLAAISPVVLCYGLLRCFVTAWHCYDFQGTYSAQDDTRAPYATAPGIRCAAMLRL